MKLLNISKLLREHILESLNSVFYAVSKNNKIKEFIPYVYCIVNYINFISSDFAKSINIIKDGLFLLADFCEKYKGDIKNILNIDNIKTMIKTIEIEGRNKISQNELDWAKETIGSLFT